MEDVENMINIYVSLSCLQMQGYPYPQHMEYGDFKCGE